MAALRFRQLELLSTLADTGNMRATAQRLHMTTAAVSKGLKDVEALFEQALFHRLPRGVVPTVAGTLVVQRGRVLLAEMEQLSDELASPLRPLHERLKIGATPFLAWTLLPAILAELAGEGQLPGLLLVEGRLADISRQLEAGEVDALITMDTPSESSAACRSRDSPSSGSAWSNGVSCVPRAIRWLPGTRARVLPCGGRTWRRSTGSCHPGRPIRG